MQLAIRRDSDSRQPTTCPLSTAGASGQEPRTAYSQLTLITSTVAC